MSNINLPPVKPGAVRMILDGKIQDVVLESGGAMKPYTATQLIADKYAFWERMGKAYWSKEKQVELFDMTKWIKLFLWDSNNTEYWGA